MPSSMALVAESNLTFKFGMLVQTLDFVSNRRNAYRRNCFSFFVKYRMNNKTTNTLYSFSITAVISHFRWQITNMKRT